MRTLQLLTCMGCLLAGTLVLGQPKPPPVGEPQPTMHTLDEIYDKLDAMAAKQTELEAKLTELDSRLTTAQEQVEGRLYEGPITLDLPSGVKLTLVRIPGGTFRMGSPSGEPGRDADEEPLHPVGIGYDFYMGMTEVTQAQWLAVMGSWPGTAPSASEGIGDSYPAYHVSWNDIAGSGGFLDTLNQHLETTGQAVAGKPLRLPSEAEWESACRGGTQTTYSYRATEGGAYMWYSANNSPNGTKPVGQKLPNPFGLYDMHGNVFEWCQDWHHDSYAGAPSDGSAWETPTGTSRVMRGGYWLGNAYSCRSAYRDSHPPGSPYSYNGFRLLRTH